MHPWQRFFAPLEGAPLVFTNLSCGLSYERIGLRVWAERQAAELENVTCKAIETSFLGEGG